MLRNRLLAACAALTLMTAAPAAEASIIGGANQAKPTPPAWLSPLTSQRAPRSGNSIARVWPACRAEPAKSYVETPAALPA